MASARHQEPVMEIFRARKEGRRNAEVHPNQRIGA